MVKLIAQLLIHMEKSLCQDTGADLVTNPGERGPLEARLVKLVMSLPHDQF